MHRFVVKFSKIVFASGGKGGIGSSNQNPANVPGSVQFISCDVNEAWLGSGASGRQRVAGTPKSRGTHRRPTPQQVHLASVDVVC